MADRHGRSVRYSYTADGRLKDVYDIAGNLWWHEYDRAGRLTGAVGTNRRPYLRVLYDAAGRVAATRSGRDYGYAYDGSRTVVTDGVGLRHMFEQNRLGATKRYGVSNGAWWEVGFDVNGRVGELDTAGRMLRCAYENADASHRTPALGARHVDGRRLGTQPQGQRRSLPRRHPQAGLRTSPRCIPTSVPYTAILHAQRRDDFLLELIQCIRKHEWAPSFKCNCPAALPESGI